GKHLGFHLPHRIAIERNRPWGRHSCLPWRTGTSAPPFVKRTPLPFQSASRSLFVLQSKDACMFRLGSVLLCGIVLIAFAVPTVGNPPDDSNSEKVLAVHTAM